MKIKSAGILLYRLKSMMPEFFLVHPGGPFFKNKDEGAWSIPKGEFEDEEALQAAIRELHEETGLLVEGPFRELTPVKQKSGKQVFAWAAEADLDENNLRCNLFKMEWPPRSGKYEEFPEVDKGNWFTLETARIKILPAQMAFLDELSLQLKMSE